jgi:hypothetical protein
MAWSDAGARRSLSFVCSVVGLAMLPFLVAVKDDHHLYQLQKLLLSVGPLLVLGLGLLHLGSPAVAIGDNATGRSWWRKRALGLMSLLPLGVVLVCGALGTGHMILQRQPSSPDWRHFETRLTAPDMRRIRDLLERSAGNDLFIAHNDWYLKSWLGYFGRRNRVWFFTPSLVNIELGQYPQTARMQSAQDLPAQALVVGEWGDQSSIFARVSPGDTRLEWSGHSLQLWRTLSSNWAFPHSVTNPNGLESRGGQPFFWIGGSPTFIDVVAGRAGSLTFTATFMLGPSLPETRTRKLRVSSTAGCEFDLVTAGGHESFKVPVLAGKTRVSLLALDPPTRARLENGDQRPLVLGVQGLEALFRPAACETGEAVAGEKVCYPQQ